MSEIMNSTKVVKAGAPERVLFLPHMWHPSHKSYSMTSKVWYLKILKLHYDIKGTSKIRHNVKKFVMPSKKIHHNVKVFIMTSNLSL